MRREGEPNINMNINSLVQWQWLLQCVVSTYVLQGLSGLLSSKSSWILALIRNYSACAASQSPERPCVVYSIYRLWQNKIQVNIIWLANFVNYPFWIITLTFPSQQDKHSCAFSNRNYCRKLNGKWSIKSVSAKYFAFMVIF